MEDDRARSLGPNEPRNKGAKQENEAGDYQTEIAHPAPIPALREHQFRKLNGNERDPHTFITEHEQEVDPVNSPQASIP